MLVRTGTLLAPLLFFLWVYAILDCIATDRSLVRNLDKTMWLIVIVILNAVGALAWLLLGRPERAGWRPGDSDYAKPNRFRGVEDLPGFSGGRAREERPRRGAAPEKRADTGARAPDEGDRADSSGGQGLSDDERSLLRRKHELDQREADLERRERELGPDAD